MKNIKKCLMVLILAICFFIIYIPISYGFVARDIAPKAEIVSKGVAILLSCMQVLQYAVPILFLVIKIIINKRKQNGKNTLKNICLYLLISIIMGLLLLGIGNLILKNTSTYGYSSKSIDYINYNGKIIYYHR